MKALVAGWFSFQDGLSTAGDLQACDLVCQWLAREGHAFDVALAPPYVGGVNWRSVDPGTYTHAIFICGPFSQYPGEIEFLARFSGCQLIGINLSMLVPLDQWNPFDLLLERDSSAHARPDITMGLPPTKTPVVGVCIVEAYGYPPGTVDAANAAIGRLLAAKEMAVVAIDTRLDTNSVGLCSPSEVEALLARMDVVITTRLHGTVLALKNGVPVVAIDPQTGGGKIRRQAEAIGWPAVLPVETLTDEALLRAYEYCLTPAARAEARTCAARAREIVEGVRQQLVSALAAGLPRDKSRESLEVVRTMALRLEAPAQRPITPEMLPAFSKVVFQRTRGPETRSGMSPP